MIEEGFRASPDKVSAITNMKSPSSLKELKSLNGTLVTLNIFLAKHAERSLPSIQTLKNCVGKSNFKRNPEAETIFQQLKYLADLPTQTALHKNELLKMYIVAAAQTFSVVLMVERGGVQTPIYYTSQVLNDMETRYTLLEKLDISYKPRTAVKGHAVVEFLAEILEGEDEEIIKDPMVAEPEIDLGW